ncbi:MAG TPA: hypothetical protein VN861_03035 [Candidatus Acidoferrales bacterium]|nr:hypothetical protein [Candidatus Acidoferrales bacterium]
MGYIYQADVYCNRCGDAIRQRLSANVPEDTLDHSSYDSDDYPKDAMVETEESDVPEHCTGCGVFFHNPLTSAGYRYVQEKLNETGLKSIYQGNMTIALKEWATWYSFTYWTAEDCADDGRHTQPGWYSNEAH